MKALYAGSFDPFTIGHYNIAVRALDIFGELIIGVGINESKKNERTVEQRIDHIRKLFDGNTKVTVIGYQGVTAEVAKDYGASVLVRGVRNTIDFEKEKELADINRKVFGIESIFLPSEPELSFVSSSMVRELDHFGKETREWIAGEM